LDYFGRILNSAEFLLDYIPGKSVECNIETTTAEARSAT
jgi:hypothetical protein